MADDGKGREVHGNELAIDARGLRKRYRGTEDGLDGVDLRVPAGTVCGLLGPNGAGKTTTIRILATLLRFDGGEASVAGHDVRARPHLVRSKIGLVGQYAAVDEVLTGRQNLVMFGRLNHLPAARARRRADELLERFALADTGAKPVAKYSGGMRRRLDLAAGLLVAPEVLFVDEPTAGLDPAARQEVWSAITALVDGGTTVLLTTQYLEEADRLADRIVLLDAGRVVAEGSPAELKARLGDDWLDVELATADDAERTARLAAPVASGPIAAGPTAAEQASGAAVTGGHRVRVPVTDRVGALVRLAAALHADGITPLDLTVRRPTLDEVFLHLTSPGGRTPATTETTEVPA